MITPESVVLLYMHGLSLQISTDLDFDCNTASTQCSGPWHWQNILSHAQAYNYLHER